MEKINLSIIILTWNGLEYTQKCLESLKNSVENCKCNVFVVDNGSTDGTLQYLSQLDWIHLISCERNVGFVRGNNIALKKIVDGDVILLNNDTIIEQDDWIKKLCETAYEEKEIGIVGCRLVNNNGLLLHAGTYILRDDYWGQQIGGGQQDIGQYKINREVEGVVFACTYIKRAVLDKIGGLNEAFFSYFEDTDYCFRAKEAGFKVVYCGEVTVIHYQNISSEINNINFSKQFIKSKETFKSLWGNQIENKYENGIAWHSVIEGNSGYAMSTKNLLSNLEDIGVDARYRYAYGKGTPILTEETGKSDEYKIEIIRKRKLKKAYPQVTYGVADVFCRNSGKYKIGYTMLETTGIPHDWVEQCNKMDEIWVPSVFNFNTFKNSGVKSPIHIIPLGVNPDLFNEEVYSFKDNNRFTFLSIFEWGERKGANILLTAFGKAFSKKDDVALICKINNNDASVDVEKELYNFKSLVNGPEVVVLYNINIRDYEMASLYRSADCFVTATRGEGWGMPILEAMACGLPVIATNWSAQTDFFNSDNGYPIDIDCLVDAKAKCRYYEGFQWAEPSEEHLIYQLRYVYENQKEAREKGKKASEEVINKWTWKAAATKIKERLEYI